jgi:hypothetical protein
MKGRWQVVVAIVAAIVLVPASVYAAVGSFSSTTATPGVKGTSSYSTGKGVAGYATSTSSSTHIGVYGNASGSGGYGVYGQGPKFGVYSNGPLGIATGKSLVCTGCVPATALAASAQPSIVTKDGSSSVAGSVGNACTSLDSITITAAAPGKITVDADVHVVINHTVGVEDWFQTNIGTAASTCSYGNSHDVDLKVNSAEPTSTDYRTTLHASNTFSVVAGTYTYNVYVKWPFGGDGSDSASRANLRAMFFPN